MTYKERVIGMLLLGQMIGLASAEPEKPVQVLEKIELIEIADHGGGVSPAKYFERITMDEPAQNSPIGEPLNREQVAQYALKNRLPIQSKLLTPGWVQSHQWKRQAFMTAAIALVGYDKASIQWLKMKKKRLEKQGAMIMVVNVKTELQFKKIQAFLPDNQVLAMSGDDVARQLKIKHYPVLITSKGIEQ